MEVQQTTLRVGCLTRPLTKWVGPYIASRNQIYLCVSKGNVTGGFHVPSTQEGGGGWRSVSGAHWFSDHYQCDVDPLLCDVTLVVSPRGILENIEMLPPSWLHPWNINKLLRNTRRKSHNLPHLIQTNYKNCLIANNRAHKHSPTPLLLGQHQEISIL